jgi:hypothetical protein
MVSIRPSTSRDRPPPRFDVSDLSVKQYLHALYLSPPGRRNPSHSWRPT